MGALSNVSSSAAGTWARSIACQYTNTGIADRQWHNRSQVQFVSCASWVRDAVGMLAVTVFVAAWAVTTHAGSCNNKPKHSRTEHRKRSMRQDFRVLGISLVDKAMQWHF